MGAPGMSYKYGDMQTQLGEDCSFLEDDNSELPAGLIGGDGGHGLDGAEGEVLLPVELVVGIIVIVVVAIVVGASQRPWISSIIEGAICMVVFGGSGSRVELAQQEEERYGANNERE